MSSLFAFRCFRFYFGATSPLVELLAAWTWTVALTSVIASVCRSCRFSCFSALSWQLDRFVVDGYAVVWWFYW
jgi:hypothetical protein